MTTILTAALTLGLVSGIAPGPLLALVISETLIHYRKNGFKVALAPLITDAPIIIATYFLLSLSSNPLILRIISLVGASYIMYLGYKNMTYKAQAISIAIDKESDRSLQKAVLVNFLNPNPYLFWSTVGTPLLKKASLSEAILFLSLFYFIMVGSKMLLAIMVEKSRHLLQDKGYLLTIRLTGLLLLGLAIAIIVQTI